MKQKITIQHLSKLSGFSATTVSKALQNDRQVNDKTKLKISELLNKINSSEITMRHLSIFSGFSISTVSKALNNSPEISVKTKNKIQRIAVKYNFVPNNSATALKRRKTKIIALIVPQIDSVIFSSMVSKIQNEAFNEGYRLLIMETLYCNKMELDCANTLRDGCVDGIIIIKTNNTPNYSNNGVSSSLINYNCPYVTQGLNESVIKKIESKFIALRSFRMLLAKIKSTDVN